MVERRRYAEALLAREQAVQVGIDLVVAQQELALPGQAAVRPGLVDLDHDLARASAAQADPAEADRRVDALACRGHVDRLDRAAQGVAKAGLQVAERSGGDAVAFHHGLGENSALNWRGHVAVSLGRAAGPSSVIS